MGAHLVNHLQALPFELAYWREGGEEVDYVVRAADRLWAIEVKSGRSARHSGLAAFRRRHLHAIPVLLSTGTAALEEFFEAEPAEWLQALA